MRGLFFFFPSEGIPLHLLFPEFHLPFCCPGTWYRFALLCTFLQSGLGWITQLISVLHVNTVTLLLTPFSQVMYEKYRSCEDPAGNSSFFTERGLVYSSEIPITIYYFIALCFACSSTLECIGSKIRA